MRPEQFIKDYTKRCSNKLTNGDYHEWMTPGQAQRAVELAREEIIRWFRNNGKNYFQANQARVLNCMCYDLEIRIREDRL